MGNLKLKTKIGYGLGDLASNLVFQLTVIYLLFFYTDVLGISAMAAGIIFLVARLWDAVNDPVMGMLMDKTKSRHGKARVYLLYGSLPLALATIAMFSTPELGITGKIVYAGVTYIIWGMLFTLVNIPYSSLTASLTDDPQERTSLSSIRMIFMLIGVITVSVVTEPLVSAFSTLSEGYFFVSIIFGLLSFIFFLFCFKLTKVATKNKSISDDSYHIRDIWPLLFKNKQLLIVTLASLVGNMAVFIRETAAIYYVNYNIGNGDLLPVFLGVVVLSMLIANLLIPLATRLWDKKGTYIIGSVIGIIGSIIFHFIPYDQIGLILLFGGLSSFGIAAISTVGWAMIPDTIEYGEWKTGKRAEGISYAVYSFSQKLATAVAGILVAAVLEWTNYVPNSINQSESTLTGILSTLTIIPIVLIIISVIVIRFYKINNGMFSKILSELKTRKKGESNV
ncbi:MAG: MFS transporter [Spirochaetaceae bacterium]